MTARQRRPRGATILELMISMVILTGVIVVFATVFPSGYRLNAANLRQNKAASLASAVLEEIKALPFADATFENGQPSQIFTVAALAPTAVQNGWPGVRVTNTNPPDNTQPIVTDFGSPIGTVNFPHTVITVGTPQPSLPGDQGIFTLPIQPADTPAGVTGIDVHVSAMDLRNGNPVTLPALSMMTATIRVTVAWSETRQTGGVVENKSVTLTGYVSRNVSQ